MRTKVLKHENCKVLSMCGPDSTTIGVDLAMLHGALMNCSTRRASVCTPQVNYVSGALMGTRGAIGDVFWRLMCRRALNSWPAWGGFGGWFGQEFRVWGSILGSGFLLILLETSIKIKPDPKLGPWAQLRVGFYFDYRCRRLSNENPTLSWAHHFLEHILTHLGQGWVAIGTPYPGRCLGGGGVNPLLGPTQDHKSMVCLGWVWGGGPLSGPL